MDRLYRERGAKLTVYSWTELLSGTVRTEYGKNNLNQVQTQKARCLHTDFRHGSTAGLFLSNAYKNGSFCSTVAVSLFPVYSLGQYAETAIYVSAVCFSG